MSSKSQDDKINIQSTILLKAKYNIQMKIIKIIIIIQLRDQELIYVSYKQNIEMN